MKKTLRFNVKTFWHFIIMVILSFAFGCHHEPANTFGIYLTSEAVEATKLVEGKEDWLHMALQPTPIISEADILAYDFKEHSLSLKPGVLEQALKRLPPMTVCGIPFIFIVNGERIYFGAFMTPLSSASMPAPSIEIWPIKARENTLQIDRCYPGPFGFNTEPDPRSDERISRALAAVHKLK